MSDLPQQKSQEHSLAVPPRRENLGNLSPWRRIAYFWMRLSQRLSFNVVYRRNLVAYLRHLGARIGSDCDLLNRPDDYGSEPWLIEIGNHVIIVAGTVMFTHDGASKLFRDRMPGMNRFGNKFGTITIHDNCFIGLNSTICMGVSIGPNSIIGAGSVVTRNVPANSVAAGNPARVLCSLDEYIERYQKKMLSLLATNRIELRRELTTLLWGQER